MPEQFPTPERRPTTVPAAETPGLNGLLTLAVGVVVVAGLYLGRTVLIPITLAVLLSFVLAPLVGLLRRIHLGRVSSVLLAVLVALSITLALGGLIGMQIAELAQGCPVTRRRFRIRSTPFRALRWPGWARLCAGSDNNSTRPESRPLTLLLRPVGRRNQDRCGWRFISLSRAR
jgi:hypothetical protein